MNVPWAACLVATAAALLLLPTAARAKSRTKTVDTASFGPGNPDQDASSYLGVIAASFEGAQLDQRGVYPSEQPPAVADYSAALHGNGFWSSGALDNDPASPPQPRNVVKFTAPGTYDYYCLIHPFMHGQVVVTP